MVHLYIYILRSEIMADDDIIITILFLHITLLFREYYIGEEKHFKMVIPQYQFPPFELSDAQSAGPRWKKWLNRFDNYMVAMDITESNRQKAMLLHFAGKRVADIYDTMKSETDEYTDAKTKLTNYFAPQVNLHYEIYVFRNAKQEDTETVDQFCTRLRTLAATCEFTDIDRELQSKIIQNCQSQELRRRALRNPKMTLRATCTCTNSRSQ